MSVKPLLIAFDSNIPALPSVRAFWGTLCEAVGQRMALTPTAASELLRRVRLETEREWDSRLRLLKADGEISLRPGDIRRLSTAAGNAARDMLRHEMRNSNGIYAAAHEAGQAVLALEEALYELMPEDIFDPTTDNGIRDRKIVIESLARGFNVLASNNTHSIDHNGLKDWVETDEAKRLKIQSTILRPQGAERKLRKHYGKPADWTVRALARSCVTDPHNAKRAVKEMADALQPFDERGMGELQMRINKVLMNKKNWTQC